MKHIIKMILVYLIPIIVALLITFPIINSAYGQIEQDGGGTWQIDTFKVDPLDTHPYLMLVQSYNPNDTEKLSKPILSGKPSTIDCASNFHQNKDKAQSLITDLIEKIIKITDDKYIIAVGASICYDNWYVIYLHDGKNFVGKPIYDKIWESIPQEYKP